MAVGDELMEVKNRPGFEPKLWELRQARCLRSTGHFRRARCGSSGSTWLVL